MKTSFTERYQISLLGLAATVATSLSFFPALSQKSYLVQGAFFAGLLVAFAMVLRAVRTHAVVVVLAQLVALVELLLLRFGDHQRWLVFPTAATFRGIDHVLASGSAVAQKYAAPAPPNAGLLLMVIFAICVMAILVDFLAAGLGRVPLAGLPLLALYTVPVAALPEGVPFYAFVPGAAVFIAMLMADERDRLSHWGRLVSRASTAADPLRIDTSGLNATGRRVSLLAVTAAVFLPIFIPAFSSTLLDGGRGSGPGDGPGQVLSFEDPMVSLANSLRRKDPVDLIKISSDTTPEYLRLVVLDTPGPNAWTTQGLDFSGTIPLGSVLPPPTGLSPDVAATPQTMSVTLTNDFPSDSAWLPVPFDVRFIGAGSDFAYVIADQTVASHRTGAIADASSYDVSFSTIAPTIEQLKRAGPPPADIMRRFGQLPADVPPVVGDTAQAVTAGATTPYEQAVLLQSFFRDRGQFIYDLTAGYGYGYNAMADFLDKRRGFCQHFAATMAMMARQLGIPSRVVVGFLQPEPDGNDYVLTSHNVHSWPELYFQGVGWVRFEPTPRADAPLPSYAPITTNPTQTATGPGESRPSGANTLNEPQNSGRDPSLGAAGSSGSSGGQGGLLSRGWLVVLGVVIVVLLPAGLRQGVRRSRMSRPLDVATAAESAWTELRDHVRDLRLPWTGSMTPRARERSLAPFLHEDADGQRALNRLTLSVERARYATSLAADATPAEDAREVMAVISRASDTSQRVVAFLWPSSLMPDLRIGWNRLTDRVRDLPWPGRGRFGRSPLSSRRDDDASDLPSGS